MARTKAVASWSTGKDSTLALHEVLRAGDVEIVGIMTTITSSFGRVSMHGVREALLDQQAEALGLRCWKVPIPSPCPNEVYERAMGRALGEIKELGVSAVVFGDLFLEDIRRYRETRLAEVGMHGIFPLWGRKTDDLARKMIAVCGIRATARAWIRGSSIARSRAAASTVPCSRLSRRASIRAARTASFTRSRGVAPTSGGRSPSRWARWSIGTASCSRTSCRPRERPRARRQAGGRTSRILLFTWVRCESGAMWPARGIITTEAPGMASPRRCTTLRAAIGDASPVKRRTGTPILP